jgi:hypothetical protein
MLSRRASLLGLALSLAVVTAHAQTPDKPLVFTRATIVASVGWNYGYLVAELPDLR